MGKAKQRVTVTKVKRKTVKRKSSSGGKQKRCPSCGRYM